MSSDAKYILTFEDGQLKTARTISEDDIQDADDGYLSIIRVSDLHEYIGNGNWMSIPSV